MPRRETNHLQQISQCLREPEGAFACLRVFVKKKEEKKPRKWGKKIMMVRACVCVRVNERSWVHVYVSVHESVSTRTYTYVNPLGWYKDRRREKKRRRKQQK